jgi:acyl carrier protein
MDVRQRILQIVAAKYGRAEENLMASGLVDSLRAVELAMLLEKEFALDADTFTLSDMKTVSSISKRVLAGL